MRYTDLAREGIEMAGVIDSRNFNIAPPSQAEGRNPFNGHFETWLNRRDHQVDPNIVPLEARNYLLKSGIKAVGALGNWFVVPFLNNVTLADALTAANFDATLDEFELYDEATRVAWTVPTDPSAASFTNAASPASFTIAAGVSGVSIIGAGIVSASAKGATSGKLLCASKFATARVVNSGDVLTVQYTLSATSTS